MDKFKIIEADEFVRKLTKRPYNSIGEKLLSYAYPILRENPYFGPNIKKLKGEFKDLYRYRIGKFRVFYSIDQESIIIIMIDIQLRKDSY